MRGSRGWLEVARVSGVIQMLITSPSRSDLGPFPLQLPNPLSWGGLYLPSLAGSTVSWVHCLPRQQVSWKPSIQHRAWHGVRCAGKTVKLNLQLWGGKGCSHMELEMVNVPQEAPDSVPPFISTQEGLWLWKFLYVAFNRSNRLMGNDALRPRTEPWRRSYEVEL